MAGAVAEDASTAVDDDIEDELPVLLVGVRVGTTALAVLDAPELLATDVPPPFDPPASPLERHGS